MMEAKLLKRSDVLGSFGFWTCLGTLCFLHLNARTLGEDHSAERGFIPGASRALPRPAVTAD